MSTPNIHLSVDYDEGAPGTYRAVDVTGPGELVKRFETGDAPADWRAAVIHAVGQKEGAPGAAIFLSSSCDHFCMDDESYCWDENSMIQRSINV